MSEAPERLHLLFVPELVKDGDRVPAYTEYPEWADDEKHLHEYRRASPISEETMETLRDLLRREDKGDWDAPSKDACVALLRDILQELSP